MRNLLRYFLKNYAFVLFLLMEGIALTLVFSHNSYQKSKYLNSANKITGNIYQSFNALVGYFQLARINQALSEENARLRNLAGLGPDESIAFDSLAIPRGESDSTFRFFPARVVNNSVNRPFNYFTLDKGEKHGVKPDQGVISEKGIVGVITHVSESFSIGLSVLNRRWSISSMVKKNGYFGSLVWREMNYQLADLTEIPLHVNIAVGDTIVTSGYSSVFPRGIMVGTIHDFSRPEGENYYAIRVKLSTDFMILSYVEVIDNLNKPELDKLEKIIGDDALDN